MQYNQMQIIKRRFFAMRNGMLGDTLRKAGLDYRMIFGLNLPQIPDIAADLPHTPSLAAELWADTRTRESLLLAPMLYPVSEMSADTAAAWLAQAPTTEVADVLCLRLLRRHPDALAIALDALDAPAEITRYAALRLLFNLLILAQSPTSGSHGQAAALAADIRPHIEAALASATPLTRPIAAQLLDEIDFSLES